MLRDKTAIGDFDRVALCPLAGHLTSSYWIACHLQLTIVRSEKTEILIEALDCRF